MNILYISYDGLTDPLGQSQILPYLISCSSENLGFTVISFEKKKAYQAEKDRVKEMLDNAGITWYPKRYTKRPPLLSSLIDLVKMIGAAMRIYDEKPFQLIHCRSYVPAYAAFYLKKKLGIKVLFDMRGFWADERIEGEIWNKNNVIHHALYKHIKGKEKNWWREADHMVSLTEKGKEIICADNSSGFEKKITVIPCCADENLFTTSIGDEQKKRLKEDLAIRDPEKLLIYVGSLGTWYLGREMMAQFADLHKRKLIDRFLWITKDSKINVTRLTEEFDLPESSVLVRSASRNEVPLYLSIADIGIFYIKPSFSKNASSPTKLGEMLLCGLPVIGNSGVGDLDTFFNQNDIGYIHEINNDGFTSIEDAVIMNLMVKPKKEIREVGLKFLSLEIAMHRYLEIYKSLSG